MSNIEDFESMLPEKFAGARLRAVERDYPELVSHIVAMKQVLADRNRGRVRLAYDPKDEEAAVYFVLEEGKLNGFRLTIQWTIAHDGLIWRHRSGTIRYPLVTDEAQKHTERDAWIRQLNAEVASVVNA